MNRVNSSMESSDVVDGNLPGRFSLMSLFGKSHNLTASTSPEEECYDMNHLKRGLAIIFNHEKFANRELNDRVGTTVDCDALSTCLNKLGFEVEQYKDLKLKGIKKVLAEVAEKDHRDHDCLVIAVLTYAKIHQLCAYDITYDSQIIWSYYTAKKCPTLAGKPKIFFIQACKSELKAVQSNYGRTVLDGGSSMSFRIPIISDILIAYSTVPGTYNRQYEQQGSWFIQELCLELRNNGDRLSLLTLLTLVFGRVANHLDQRLENGKEQSIADEEEEIPNFTSTLRHFIIFTPKIEAAQGF